MTESIVIGGMSCQHCVKAVERALTSVDGVLVEEVRIGGATVSYDPELVDREQIAEAIVEEGYSVEAGRQE